MKRNLLANYIGTLFVAGSQILTIPLYLRYLGQTGWGLLSALLALAATLLILEVGVSQAVARGFSERKHADTRIDLGSFQRVERNYLAFVLTSACIFALAADSLGRVLFSHAGDSGARLAQIAVLMAASQILGSLYRGALVGYGAQVQLNASIIGAVAVRHSAGIYLAAVGHELVPVAMVIALSFTAEAALRRCILLNVIVRQTPTAAKPPDGPSMARGALPLALAGMLAALWTQIDRLYLSASISPIALGHYSIAASLSLATLQLIYPISSAWMPHLARFRSKAHIGLMLRSYGLLLLLLLVIWIVAAAIAFKGLSIWLPHVPGHDVASAVAPLFLTHLIGTSLNALCVPLHFKLLAEHLDRQILVVNGCSLAVVLATLATLTPQYGALAASLAWTFGSATLMAGFIVAYIRSTRHHAQVS